MDIAGSGGIISSPGTEDEKLARRRSRRVSFADTTAVRVFDRDEDFETPPDERSPSASPSPGRSSAEREDGDDTLEFPRPPVFFPQEIDSSSPGSGAGSFASADDENFFGPVSTSFILTGRPSDSGISEDDNHDITLDSKTFSMHFRNIDPPDDCTANSAGSLRTSDTALKGTLEELNVSEPRGKSTSGCDVLTDMSLLTGNPITYGYDKLSPTMNNIMQKLEQGQQANSPITTVDDVNPDRVLVLAATEEGRMEENSCIGNGIFSNELVTVNITGEHTSMGNPVPTSTNPIPIQEDNAMIIDGHGKFQEKCNHDHMVVDSGVNNTVEPPPKLSPAYKSSMNDVDLQPHLSHQSLSKDQPSESNGTTHASSDVHLEHNLLDQVLSKDQPPGTNDIINDSQLSIAAPAITLKDAKKLNQQNEVTDTENILLTPRVVGRQLEVSQGSISSLRSKRQKLFDATPQSSVNDVDLQPHLLHQSLSKDQPSESNGTTRASSNVHLEPNLLDQPLSKDQPPGTNDIINDSQLSIAALDISLKDAKQLHQQNEVTDMENILHTPRVVGRQLEVPQGSISSLRSKRQRLSSSTPLSYSKVTSQEAYSLDSEFVKHGRRLSAVENVLKLRLQERPAASRLPLRNETGRQANDIFSNAEDCNSTLSVSCSSVPRRQLKKTGESFIPVTPQEQGLNEATKVQDTSCDVLALDSQPSHECNSLLDSDGGGRKRIVKETGHAEQERLEVTAKAAISPGKSRRQLACVSQSSYMIEQRHNGANCGQPVNVDWNKVVCNISNATEHVFSASISKLNLRQLDTLGDKLDGIQMARKYKSLSTAVRVQNCCCDKQKRLAEARSLHEKFLYEKAKLQINNTKLAKLRNKTQLRQIGIQECSFLKSKIPDCAQMKDASHCATSLINASDRQEGLAVVTKKSLELNIVQQKVENIRSSLECFDNINDDIICDSVMRSAEEQLDMRNQCRLIHQQAGLWELIDIVKRDNKRDVILKYRDLLFQRIILNISDVSCIFVNNSLNGTKIGKTFPNLDASVAFNFVFKAEENQRVSDLQSLQKKIMETSLLLGNLIDVLEEIKIAKIELLNLTSAAFVFESQTCQLVLRLCFLSFKSGKMIAFSIDMTDLNRSVYPSEPSELLIKVCKAQTTLSQPSTEETLVSIRNLQPSRMMMLRLCRMVSQLLQSLPV